MGERVEIHPATGMVAALLLASNGVYEVVVSLPLDELHNFILEARSVENHLRWRAAEYLGVRFGDTRSPLHLARKGEKLLLCGRPVPEYGAIPLKAVQVSDELCSICRARYEKSEAGKP